MKNKIYMAGGSGLIGLRLKQKLEKQGYEVLILSRSKEGKGYLKYPEDPKALSREIDSSLALINLAGASIVGKRWNAEYKKELYDSRILTTRYLVDSIKGCDNKPEIFISSSAIGYYGDRGDEELIEKTESVPGFISQLCKDWEFEALELNSIIPVFIPRISVVLAKEGGALSEMVTPFKYFVGGPIGSGNQYFSWVSIEDLVNVFLWAIINKTNGIYNLASPNPIRFKDFAKALGKAMNRPSIFKVPSFMMKLILGEASQEVLRSQKVLPNALIEAGYEFLDPQIDEYLKKNFTKS